MIAEGVISKPHAAYTPSVVITVNSRPAIADRDILTVRKYRAMPTVARATNAISPQVACRVTPAPQEGPTKEEVTSSSVTW